MTGTFYATVTQVKDLMRKMVYTEFDYASDADFVTAIESMLTDVDAIIDNHTHSYFMSHASITEIFDGKYEDKYFVKYGPIIALTKVEMRGSQTDSWAEQTLTDFYVYRNWILYEGGFTQGYQNYRITYTYGYADTPPAIKRATIMLVGNILTQMRLNGLNQLMSLNQFTLRVPEQVLFTPDIKAILAPYVRPPVGFS